MKQMSVWVGSCGSDNVGGMPQWSKARSVAAFQQAGAGM